ncbi:NAD(+)--arginine ADP-ribosyltransferase [Mycobacterium kansasii]|nr:NAD(+)--arginine ADP-ribosyltransferase [Mycobacterium kansasii]
MPTTRAPCRRIAVCGRELMTTLAVDPAALDGAGAAVVAAGETLGSVTSTLTGALAGSAGMAGDDPAGEQFGRAYDETAATVLQAMAVTRNGLCNLGDGVRMTAHNYSLAEAMSDVAGRAAPLPVPQPTSCVAASSAASAIGNGDSAPAGWGWVAPYIGMIWPNGDSGKLRAAAAAWRNAGTQFAVAEIHATAAPMNAIRAQQLPEAGLIEGAFSDAYSGATAIVGQCQTIATGLDKYAAKIDAVHAAILDLLSRICDPLTGIKEVWEFLTDEDEDEIARIAHDIATVVDNFTGEVDALGNQIGEAVAQAHTTITNMGRLAAKEWEQFLQGNPVGWLINFTGQRFKGMGEIVWGLGETAWNYNQIRALLDPVGYGRDVGGMALGMAPLVGLGGDHAPGWLESWKEVIKDNVHWDDWARNPGEAYGKMEADVATNFFPEGPAAKLDRAREIADKLKAFRERLFGTRDHGGSKPPEPPTPTGPKAEPPDQPQPPRDQQPQSGSPTPGPQSKPGAGDNPLPKSPTESKTPLENKATTGEPAKPNGSQPDSVGTPGGSVSAPSGEKLPPGHSQPDEPISAQVPAASSGESPSAAQSAAGSKPLAASTPASGSPGHSTLAGHQLSHGGTQSGGVGDAHPNEPSPLQGGGHWDEGGGAPHEPSPPGDDSQRGDHGQHHGKDDKPTTAREAFPEAKAYGDLSEPEYQNLFEDENGHLIYPDASDPAKPYAIPGSVHNMTKAEILAHLNGTLLDRIGYPGGGWLAPEGTPYEARAIPHDSLDKPYFVYEVQAEKGLPPGWTIEYSRAAPWFGQPGGGPNIA